MTKKTKQRQLPPERIREFHHAGFIRDQVDHFQRLAAGVASSEHFVVDVGGGVGRFAEALSNCSGLKVRVLDRDEGSVILARAKGIEAEVGDACDPCIRGDESFVTLNLVLHHLVGSSERVTRDLQKQALCSWADSNTKVFVNEYIYESSIISGFASSVIYGVTKSSFLSLILNIVSSVLPSLRANTSGVGVRFRPSADWRVVFKDAGLDVDGYVRGDEERIPLLLRLLLVKSIRRDSWLLKNAE